jgi:hypothetical protein
LQICANLAYATRRRVHWSHDSLGAESRPRASFPFPSQARHWRLVKTGDSTSLVLLFISSVTYSCQARPVRADIVWPTAKAVGRGGTPWS